MANLSLKEDCLLANGYHFPHKFQRDGIEVTVNLIEDSSSLNNTFHMVGKCNGHVYNQIFHISYSSGPEAYIHVMEMAYERIRLELAQYAKKSEEEKHKPPSYVVYWSGSNKVYTEEDKHTNPWLLVKMKPEEETEKKTVKKKNPSPRNTKKNLESVSNGLIHTPRMVAV